MKARKKDSNDEWKDVQYVQLRDSYVIQPAEYMEFRDTLSTELKTYAQITSETQTQDHWQDVRERAAIAAMQGLINAFSDLLFQKMHEAGYEWDADEKELKKISQRMISAEAKEALYGKPAWSEEDEVGWTNTMIMIKEVASNHYTKDSVKLVMDWLKSLKDRINWRPSEEQMKALHDLNLTGNISYAGQGQVLIELYNDLKKLK